MLYFKSFQMYKKKLFVLYTNKLLFSWKNFKTIVNLIYSSIDTSLPTFCNKSNRPIQYLWYIYSINWSLWGFKNTIGHITKSGPDLLPPILFQNCHNALAQPVYFLFNLSLSSKAYPLLYKTSYVYLIFKSGDKSLSINYRPISKFSF